MKKILLIAFMMILCMASTYASLTDGLMYYYKLDEATGINVIDSINAKNGTNHGASINVTGLINKSYSLDGIDDYIDFNGNTGIDLSDGTETYNVWVKDCSRVGVNDWGGMLLFETSTSANVMIFIRFNSTHFQPIRLRENLAYDEFIEQIPYDNTSWQMITLILNANGRTLTFLNGELKANTTFTLGGGSSGVSENVLYIGTQTKNAQGYIDGVFDEFSIYNRSLDESEILSLYNSGNGLTYPFTSTVDSINLSIPQPSNNSNFSTQEISFNLSMNNSFTTNCSLFLNNSLNETKIFSGGVNTFVDFQKNFSTGNYDYFINCTQATRITKS